MGVERIILLLVISSTLAEDIPYEVHLSLCIPSNRCSDCLRADVSMADGTFSLLLKNRIGIEYHTETFKLDACKIISRFRNKDPLNVNLTEVQLKFVEESSDECNGSNVICNKLHLPQKNYSLQCNTTTPYPEIEYSVVREYDSFSLCVFLNDSNHSTVHQVALYPIIWSIDVERNTLFVSGDKAVLNLTATRDAGRYCTSTTFPCGYIPTEVFFLFTVSVGGPAITTLSEEECTLSVINKNYPWRPCSANEHESQFYCRSNSIQHGECYQFDYTDIPRATTALSSLDKYPFLMYIIKNNIVGFYKFVIALQEILVHQSGQASTHVCPTNCTLQSVCTDDPYCTSSLTLLSGVPHVVAENLTKLQDSSTIISCCNVSCPTDPMHPRTGLGTIISGVISFLVLISMIILLGAIVYCFCHHHKKKKETRHVDVGQRENECYDNPNYAQHLAVLGMDYQVSQNREYRETATGQQGESFSKWRDNFTGKSIKFIQLDIQEVLGEGEFGKVHKGRLVSTDETASTSSSPSVLVAIKSIKSEDVTAQEIEDFLAESMIMLEFNHPNVMKLVGVCFDTDNKKPLIILPYMANGDLKSFLKTKRMNNTTNDDEEHFPNGLSEAVLMRMCLDIAQGMEYLSRTKFVHRDLAARNCMVDATLTVCVSDFGLSRDIFYSDYYRLTHTARLPFKWMAPESLKDYIYNEKSDVWSFGVVCWEVFSLGCVPFPGVDNADILEYISEGNRLKHPPLCPTNMYEIMHSTWKRAPEGRPSFLQLTLSLAELLGQDSASHDYHVLEMTTEAREESLSQPDISEPLT